MLSVCDLRDEGKWPYTENTSVQSENLVIQVQKGIKSKLLFVLHALTVVSGNVVLSSLITNYIDVVILV